MTLVICQGKAGQDQLDSLGGTREALGRQERTNWTACEAPGRHQGGNREGGTRERHQGGRKDHLDSLGGTREAQGRHQGLFLAILRYETYVAG